MSERQCHVLGVEVALGRCTFGAEFFSDCNGLCPNRWNDGGSLFNLNLFFVRY